ncbi:hypothetical protein E2562_012050 [Oryza meyeriana var. granulata]|uniref:Secreted protein n=1 Tax=Oryza meyeriana var. granulata TaxID=110450 RepID=A0A6G1D2D7_9ORYZ|nr:hypothetical protein E2562_012050 [Oryza meyeriana var. granulata]
MPLCSPALLLCLCARVVLVVLIVRAPCAIHLLCAASCNPLASATRCAGAMHKRCRDLACRSTHEHSSSSPRAHTASP